MPTIKWRNSDTNGKNSPFGSHGGGNLRWESSKNTKTVQWNQIGTEYCHNLKIPSYKIPLLQRVKHVFVSGETWQKSHSSCLQVSIYTTSLRPLCRVYMYYVYITSAIYITRAGGAWLSIPFDLLHWEEHNITFGIFLLGMLDLILLKKKQWTDLDWGLCRLLNLSRTWIWGQDWEIAPYLKERDWTRMGK